MRVFDILGKSARDHPAHIAAIHSNRNITYRDLLISASKIASFLEGLDLAKGSRAAIMFENSIEYLIAYFAASRAGYVIVPIDTSLNPQRITHILGDCQADILIFHTKYERLLPKILGDRSPVRFIISDRELRHRPVNVSTETIQGILDGSHALIEDNGLEYTGSESKPLRFDLEKESADSPHELAAIFYTSGSTGSPKGVMLSHRNLVSNTIATVEYLKLGPIDRVIVILPFYYIYGNSLLLTHILVGGTLVIDNRFMYPEVVLDTMEKEKVTGFSGVPSNFMILFNKSTFTSRQFKHLRYFTQAGGAMAPEVIRKLMNAFPEKEIYIMYGQTEASPRVSYLPPERLKDKVGSIGIPLPGVNIKIVNEEGAEVAVGQEGEIAVSGDNVMIGYWNQPEEEKEVLKHGWLYTGDLARRDDEGYIYIVGRKKEIIKTGGNRVSVKEVEECIMENDKVAEATVFGVRDDVLGEAVKAMVVLKDGASINTKDIKNFCKTRLADYKVPKFVEFVDSLPKYESGKINKSRLIEEESSG